MISWFEWCDVILSNSDGFWQDKSNCAMCQAQECGNMPPGHITVVKYKQRIIKKDNFHRTPDNPHHKPSSVLTMKWSEKYWECLLLILLFPEVRPPLLVRLILTTYSTSHDCILRSSSRWNAVRAVTRDLEWLSEASDQGGAGRGMDNPQRTETSDSRCLWFITREEGNCQALISSFA